MRNIDEVSGDVLDVALRLHRRLGPGLLESVYEALLAAELQQRGHRAGRRVPVTFVYNEMKFENAFRADLIVDERLIIEVKSVERLMAVHTKQLLTYLRLMEQPLGLLINFGGETLREGLRRVVNNHNGVAP